MDQNPTWHHKSPREFLRNDQLPCMLNAKDVNLKGHFSYLYLLFNTCFGINIFFEIQINTIDGKG